MSGAAPLPAHPTAASVLVVVVTYNSQDTIVDFLDSVSAATARPVSVVVVDNHSEDRDRVEPLVGQRGAQFVALNENRGYGGGVAAGVAEHVGSPDFIVVANPDMVFHENAIDVLVDAATAHPRVGSVGPRILNDDGTLYPSARSQPSLRNGIGHAVFARVWPQNPWTRRYRQETDADQLRRRSAGWLSGACLVVRREAWDQVGGFDERFFMYFEDVDLGARLTRAGWSNLYVPDAVVTHTGGHSTAQVSAAMEREHHRSAYQYLANRYPSWYYAPLRLILKAALSLRLRATLLRKR